MKIIFLMLITLSSIATEGLKTTDYDQKTIEKGDSSAQELTEEQKKQYKEMLEKGKKYLEERNKYLKELEKED